MIFRNVKIHATDIDNSNLFGDIIREGQEEGIFKKEIIPDIAKRAFFGALDEMSRFWVLSSRKKYDIETAAKQISEYFLYGLIYNPDKKTNISTY